MNTPITLQQSVLDHLASLDLGEMSLEEIQLYTSIVGQLHMMAKPDFTESMLSALYSRGFNGPKEMEA